MAKKFKYQYIVEIQYLGFRFHGFAKQIDVKTIHQYIDYSLSFTFENHDFKTIGGSRTDAMVSANSLYFSLFSDHKDLGEEFIDKFNHNLPTDMHCLGVQLAGNTFNIIQNPKDKEYHYLFCFGERPHPFCAPLMAFIRQPLDISLMQEAAQVFLGEHNFSNYVTKPSENTKTIREVTQSEIVVNEQYSASFFPKESFLYKVKSKGFMRNQIRLMVAQLIEVGNGNRDIEYIKNTLIVKNEKPFIEIAQASGLILHQTNLVNSGTRN